MNNYLDRCIEKAGTWSFEISGTWTNGIRICSAHRFLQEFVKSGPASWWKWRTLTFLVQRED
jgi:hypothetical protein